ncbi:hypothetical protein TELCIR_15539 [Teladorsagia circumcincta]|uniref:Uncharacterized protein n=1 Tax=Teladorsagia circumcincta TaxID=45464 RepID=A0A2G9TY66_TELCI|nr:hypothetical protein TELCIR_15539 [Teladorsagia circumcincta]
MSAVGDERSDKRMELERKKQKLAEMREARRRADEEKKRQLLASVPVENGVTKQSLTSTEVQELLAEVGIPTEPRLEKTPERTNGLSDSDYHLSPMASQIMAGSRSLQLEFSNVHSVAIPTKDAPETVKEEPAPVRIPDLSEEEKNQIVASQGFQTFFNYAAKVIERALAEAENVREPVIQ